MVENSPNMVQKWTKNGPKTVKTFKKWSMHGPNYIFYIKTINLAYAHICGIQCIYEVVLHFVTDKFKKKNKAIIDEIAPVTNV